ncbi:MAG: hypothetical protein LBQ79_13500 [Deltaproteobacteria bacterium]|jgi:hypothetical protein|nr:hypothetical protein [Deltaproteobacteria bacterium]
MARTLIATTLLSQSATAAVDGMRLINVHGLFASLLAQELPTGRAGLLSEPKSDHASGELNWYTELDGPVTAAEDLPRGEQRFIEEALAERIAELSALAVSLRGSPATNRQLAGRMVEKLVQSAADWRLFSVGGQPVVSGWGLEPVLGGQRALPGLLTEDDGFGSVPPGQMPGYVPGYPSGEGWDRHGWSGGYPPPPAAAAGNWSWLKFLLALFLPLLLLLLLLLFVFPGFYGLDPWGGPPLAAAVGRDRDREASMGRELEDLRRRYLAQVAGCRPDSPYRTEPSPGPGDPVIPAGPIPPSAGGRDPSSPGGTVVPDGTVGPDGAVGPDDGELPGRLGGEAVPGEVQGEVQGEVPGEVQGEVPGELQGEVPGELQAEVPGELQADPNKDGQGDQGANPPEDPNRDGQGDQGANPPEDPNKDGLGDQGANPPEDPNRDGQGDQGADPPEDPNKDGRGANDPPGAADQNQQPPVDIPDSARQSGDVTFLNGCWNSRASLYNRRTRAPLNYRYCFKDGQGRVAIQVQDGSGRTVDNCAGSATARMQDGKLVIQDNGQPVCEEGGTYRSTTITCTPGDTRTECSMQQEGSRRGTATEFRQDVQGGQKG